MEVHLDAPVCQDESRNRCRKRNRMKPVGEVGIRHLRLCWSGSRDGSGCVKPPPICRSPARDAVGFACPNRLVRKCGNHSRGDQKQMNKLSSTGTISQNFPTSRTVRAKKLVLIQTGELSQESTGDDPLQSARQGNFAIPRRVRRQMCWQSLPAYGNRNVEIEVCRA